MLALNEPIFSRAAATRNHCPFPFSAIKFYIRMIACLLDLRTLFLGRVTFLPRSLAPSPRALFTPIRANTRCN